MKVAAGTAQAEYEVQRSRFLALGAPVASQEQARSLLKECKARYSDAAHVVHAFALGPEKSRIQGFGDDGEPPGTAGRPVMEVLKGSGVTNTFVAVVRWFGGIKLGTGGLVKAYTEAAKRVLDVLPVVEDLPRVRLRLNLEYQEHQALLRRLEGFEGRVVKEVFMEGVELEVELPAIHESDFRRFFGDLTRGRGFLLNLPPSMI